MDSSIESAAEQDAPSDLEIFRTEDGVRFENAENATVASGPVQRRQIEQAEQAEEASHAVKKRLKSKRRRLKRYRRLLHQGDRLDFVDTSHKNSNDFRASLIGGSYWSSAEKAKIFELLQTGSYDLTTLSRGLKSKSQLEIQAYLTDLHDKASQSISVSRKLYSSQRARIPPSLEIGSQCEDVLNDCANDLILKELAEDIEREYEIYGNEWLVDEASAADMEAASSEEPCITLLHPSVMLQLSEILLMNGPIEDGDNWRRMVAPDLGIESPCIFRSAFDQLVELVVKHTRDLVQASIFQAESRLTMTEGEKRQRQVIGDDVLTAASMLKLRTNLIDYWATFARRHHLTVFSSSKKYFDGRTLTHNGVALTYEEVEAALGPAPALNADGKIRAARDESFNSEASSLESDEHSPADFEMDWERSHSRASSNNLEYDHSSLQSNTDDEIDTAQEVKVEQKQASDPIFVYGESGSDSELDILDQQASAKEEAHIFRLLSGKSEKPKCESTPDPDPHGKKTTARSKLPCLRSVIGLSSNISEWETSRPGALAPINDAPGDLQHVKQETGWFSGTAMSWSGRHAEEEAGMRPGTNYSLGSESSEGF